MLSAKSRFFATHRRECEGDPAPLIIQVAKVIGDPLHETSPRDIIDAIDLHSHLIWVQMAG